MQIKRLTKYNGYPVIVYPEGAPAWSDMLDETGLKVSLANARGSTLLRAQPFLLADRTDLDTRISLDSTRGVFS